MDGMPSAAYALFMTPRKTWQTYCQFGSDFEAICRAAVIEAALLTYLRGRLS